MNLQKNIEKYAKLVLNTGVALKKGQELVVRCPIERADLAREITRQAFKIGAKDVIVQWKDEQLDKIKFDNCNAEYFENVPEWLALLNNSYAEKNACFITVSGNDPDLLSDVDPKKLINLNKASHNAFKKFYEKIDKGMLVWNIIAAPTKAWALKVFPNDSEEDAVNKLWDAIFKAVRVDKDDPIKEWEKHNESFKQKVKLLNDSQFTKLHYKNSLGTDLVIGMPKNHIWAGGGEYTKDNTYFCPNMPTEEIFTAPQYNDVNGVVYSSMPLNYNGNLIKDFSFTFKDGVIVDYSAKQGLEVLKEIFETDEGSKRLGEVALVPYNSPISNMNILFYNTLFDENASCHLAIGSAYQMCVEGGLEMNKEELIKAGLNTSITHIDFMIGTADLSIVATDKEGNEVAIFKDGNWAL